MNKRKVVAIIDADLIGRSHHKFPNLACMKISGYFKSKGDVEVVLKRDYEDLQKYDRVYISKVFTDTLVDEEVLMLPNVRYGGTGFFYDKAPKLPDKVEHCMPDYHLYDEWVDEQLAKGISRKKLEMYIDYSIGFTTRGCFRKCEFCVNKNSDRVERHSALDEFVDPERKVICLLDDNVLGSPHWKEIFQALRDTGKYFQYKQGLDERLLTDEKCEVLFSSRWYGDYIFAFDNVADYELVEKKLQLIRKHTYKENIKFYVLCGFDRQDKWDEDFWRQDIYDLWKRIELLMKYRVRPYVMKFARYSESPYKDAYTHISGWCNFPRDFWKFSFRERCEDKQGDKTELCNAMKCLKMLEKEMPDLAEKYFDIKFKDFEENNHKMMEKRRGRKL